ncbi:MAG TPA: DUF6265 family protein [Longimicrobiales bacterium]|nr:DUF6265 family protein [Longimicrobiales bacterium]
MPRAAPPVGSLIAVLVVAAPVPGQERFTLEDVSFLSGCWADRTGPVELREQWTEAEGGVMLGTSRFVRGGEVVDWEFGRIVEDGDGVTLWPYPRGVSSEHGFGLIRVGDENVFENLEHDFPVRIVYARARGRPGGLDVRVEGNAGQRIDWSLTRSPCPP